jgi:hypothetical protein
VNIILGPIILTNSGVQSAGGTSTRTSVPAGTATARSAHEQGLAAPRRGRTGGGECDQLPPTEPAYQRPPRFICGGDLYGPAGCWSWLEPGASCKTPAAAAVEVQATTEPHRTATAATQGVQLGGIYAPGHRAPPHCQPTDRRSSPEPGGIGICAGSGCAIQSTSSWVLQSRPWAGGACWWDSKRNRRAPCVGSASLITNWKLEGTNRDNKLQVMGPSTNPAHQL